MSVLTKDEWLQRCSARFMLCLDCDQALAEYLANGRYDFMDDDDRSLETPEEAADEALLDWTDDDGE